jgi:hypothetical protein
MKAHLILGVVFALAAVAAQADTTTAAQPAPIASNAPKNLARQHLGANLMIFNETSQAYEPTEAAAAWLDDDIATGWPAMTGKQDYLLALSEPQLVNNFCISARSATGSVTLYAGDEVAPPGAASWTPLAKDVPIESINNKMGPSFGRFAKYILIETNLTDSGPWYSVYLYGGKPATAYHIQQRAQPVDPRTIFGPYTNPETSISLSSLYAHATVTMAGGATSAWQNAIDDNPQTGTFIPATQNDAGLAIQYDRSYAIQRISLLTDEGTKGKLELFVINQLAQKTTPTTSRDSGSQYIKVANESGTPDAAPSGPDLTNLQPAATINFDGSSPRASIDFTPTSGTELVARWTPDAAGQPLGIREIDSFGDVALNDYQLAPDAVGDESAAANESGGKETIPAVGEEGKESLPPAVGEELPEKTAFIPGVPVFPPNIPFSP